MALYQPVNISGIYFITFTCYQWLPLLEQVKGYDLVYKWFDVLTSQNHTVVGYVIMPNHLHLLLNYQSQGVSLNTIVGNGKRFLAYGIVKRLKQKQYSHLLVSLQLGVRAKDSSRGKKHQLWTRSFDVKHCRTERFVLQKLQYIHNNPCAGKWKLAETIIDYPHSSARYYRSGIYSSYRVKHYREFL